jgi:amino acid permease
MRWIVVCLGSLASGVLTIIASLVLLLVSLTIYERYVLRIASNEAVGWDPVSFFGQYWQVAVIGIPLLIFAFGCSLGFWVLQRRLFR